jgi:Fe2+ transport system protein FeoA
MEGWPKFEVGLSGGGALVVRYETTNPDSIQQVAQRFRNMGLVEGVHFSVKMPEGGRAGYVSILREGLAYAARLSVRGKGEQQKLAADFVELILQRAKEACRGAEPCAVYEKAKEIVEKGKAWGSIKLKDFGKEVEVNGKTYVVKVKGGEAVEEDRGGKPLLRIKITAEVGYVKDGQIKDRVEREYTITYIRRGGDNAVVAYAYVEVDDAERLAALIKALTDKEPRIHKSSNGKIYVACGREHLEGFGHYAELADVIEKWLEETSRR